MKASEAEVFKSEGNGYLTSGDPVRAIKPYTQAIALTPNDHTLYSNRAFAFTKAEKYERALVDAEKAVALNPKWPKGHFRRGEALRLSGLHARAREAYEKAAKLDPSDEHLASCVREAAESARLDDIFAQRILYAGVAIGALLACLIFASGKKGCTASSIVILLISGPLGQGARMIREHLRDARVAAPSMSNNDFVVHQFPTIQLHQSKKVEKAAVAEAKACDQSVKKGRVKTSSREAAMASMRSRQAK
mmetsp:Transcript_41690/g.94073  ORF Transcript_41690/g.94073 Transcript_41690/m.94073 type:complete len:249 (-) Transcript_41690:35-781(-)